MKSYYSGCPKERIYICLGDRNEVLVDLSRLSGLSKVIYLFRVIFRSILDIAKIICIVNWCNLLVTWKESVALVFFGVLAYKTDTLDQCQIRSSGSSSFVERFEVDRQSARVSIFSSFLLN